MARLSQRRMLLKLGAQNRVQAALLAQGLGVG